MASFFKKITKAIPFINDKSNNASNKRGVYIQNNDSPTIPKKNKLVAESEKATSNFNNSGVFTSPNFVTLNVMYNFFPEVYNPVHKLSNKLFSGDFFLENKPVDEETRKKIESIGFTSLVKQAVQEFLIYGTSIIALDSPNGAKIVDGKIEGDKNNIKFFVVPLAETTNYTRQTNSVDIKSFTWNSSATNISLNIESGEFIKIYEPDPKNIAFGKSPLETHFTKLSFQSEEEEDYLGFYENSSRIGIFVKVNENVSENHANAISKNVSEMKNDTRRFVGLVSQGIDGIEQIEQPKPGTLEPEMLNRIERLIAGSYGIPYQLINSEAGSGGLQNGYETLLRDFNENSVKPLQDILEPQINYFLSIILDTLDLDKNIVWKPRKMQVQSDTSIDESLRGAAEKGFITNADYLERSPLHNLNREDLSDSYLFRYKPSNIEKEALNESTADSGKDLGENQEEEVTEEKEAAKENYKIGVKKENEKSWKIDKSLDDFKFQKGEKKKIKKYFEIKSNLSAIHNKAISQIDAINETEEKTNLKKAFEEFFDDAYNVDIDKILNSENQTKEIARQVSKIKIDYSKIASPLMLIAKMGISDLVKQMQSQDAPDLGNIKPKVLEATKKALGTRLANLTNEEKIVNVKSIDTEPLKQAIEKITPEEVKEDDFNELWLVLLSMLFPYGEGKNINTATIDDIKKAISIVITNNPNVSQDEIIEKIKQKLKEYKQVRIDNNTDDSLSTISMIGLILASLPYSTKIKTKKWLLSVSDKKRKSHLSTVDQEVSYFDYFTHGDGTQQFWSGISINCKCGVEVKVNSFQNFKNTKFKRK